MTRSWHCPCDTVFVPARSAVGAGNGWGKEQVIEGTIRMDRTWSMEYILGRRGKVQSESCRVVS